ncbi:hypothetical protein Vadar_000290 [Vaccinium darrowii]|uniref:Uncharacterized protein n=1 Tax=Vaccinium darrowii TaxID=229202 RepID=A0ACB7XX85_9ERIC|nr:hypothetical protein Vadar_000290 [Vaccinium darrowii]
MANTTFPPTFGQPSTHLQGLKKQPNKSPPLKSTVKSFLPSLTPTGRTLVFIVILFNVFLVLYLTRTHILSPSESPRASPEFLPGESRIVRNISSQTYSGYGSLQTKEVLNISSQAYDGSPDNGVSDISSQTHGSLANKEVMNISSEANKGVENISSGTYGGLANKDGLNISSETFGGLPNKSCDSGRIYVYDLPPILNYDIKNNCTQLEPPDDKCDKLLNDGLGPAAKEYAGMFPESILPAFYWTDLYWGEVLFHNRMLNHRCRTIEPESATAFYIPFYAGLDVRKYLHNHTARERDRNPEMLTKWFQEQKWWKRSNGSDHIIMLGRMTWDFRRLGNTDADWGTRFLNMPAMQNVIRVTVERNVWDNLEVAVPYPTIFHPSSESDIIEWQNFLRSRRRNHLFTFVGGGRSKIKNDFRAVLKNKCLNESAVCRHVDCSGKQLPRREDGGHGGVSRLRFLSPAEGGRVYEEVGFRLHVGRFGPGFFLERNGLLAI